MADAAKIKKQIEALEEADPKSPRLKELHEELKKATGKQGGAPAPAGVYIIPGTTETEIDDLANESNAYSLIGFHTVEFQAPTEKTPGVSMAFPFTHITGQFDGKENAIYAGLGKSGRWKLIEILKALGVEFVKTQEGIGFDPATVAGKQAIVQYTGEKDNRLASEGGTGDIIPKATKVLPLGSEIPE